MELGFQEALLGPPSRPRSPRMPPAALDAADCLSVSLPALPGGNSMLAPRRRGPHPFTSHPPLPFWQGDWEKAANFKSAQRLWSCPESSTINHRASDFCFASERGGGDAWKFLFTPFCTRLRANHKQTGTQPTPPKLLLATPPSSSPLLTLLTLSLSSSTFLTLSPFPPFFPLSHLSPSSVQI